MKRQDKERETLTDVPDNLIHLRRVVVVVVVIVVVVVVVVVAMP